MVIPHDLTCPVPEAAKNSITRSSICKERLSSPFQDPVGPDYRKSVQERLVLCGLDLKRS